MKIVQEIGKHTTLKKRGFFYVGLCPFHKEKTPSFFVDAKKESFYCFGCGAKGDVVKFVMMMESLTQDEAIELLRERRNQ